MSPAGGRIAWARMSDDGAGLPDSAEPDQELPPPLPSLPAEVAAGDDELRRLIDAGASTPEELRELAARIREQRDREEAVWRSEVRPALKKAKKGRFHLGDLVERSEEPKTPNAWMFGIGLAGVAIVLVLAAAKSSILWVLLPLVGVLGYAYVQGKRGRPGGRATRRPTGTPRTDGSLPSGRDPGPHRQGAHAALGRHRRCAGGPTS